MLDDLKLIHERDAQDMLGAAEKQWQQLLVRFDEVKLNFSEPINNIVWSAIGGSAVPAQFGLTWPGAIKPLEICRGYDIPVYVNQNTLFLVASYSGNTEEMLEAITQAQAKNAQIVVMCAGGKLAELAKAQNYPLYLIPQSPSSRINNLFYLKALADIYDKLGLGSGWCQELEAAAEILRSFAPGWRPDVASKKNLAKQLALELTGRSAVIYAGPKMQAVANKLKIAINESAKTVAWFNQYPEFNHNEMMGWTGQPLEKLYAVVDIRSNLERPRILQRMELSDRLLSGRRPAANVVEPQGETLLSQLLWGLVFADFVGVYLAILHGLNPAPLELVDKFKAELNK
jgi:glucose/mannose-6-phosphate isomerase